MSFDINLIKTSIDHAFDYAITAFTASPGIDAAFVDAKSVFDATWASASQSVSGVLAPAEVLKLVNGLFDDIEAPLTGWARLGVDALKKGVLAKLSELLGA